MDTDVSPQEKPFIGRPPKTINGQALIPAVVSAALGAQTFRKATREIAQEEKDALSRVLRQDVDEWRSDFARQLRETGQELLALTRRDLALIKPDARAYTLAVLIDKASALEGRSALTNASVNIQVNNYGSAPKESLLADLDGLGTPRKGRPDDSKQEAIEAETIASFPPMTFPGAPATPDPVATSAGQASAESGNRT
jgi:hypothetical protein